MQMYTSRGVAPSQIPAGQQSDSISARHRSVPLVATSKHVPFPHMFMVNTGWRCEHGRGGARDGRGAVRARRGGRAAHEASRGARAAAGAGARARPADRWAHEARGRRPGAAERGHARRAGWRQRQRQARTASCRLRAHPVRYSSRHAARVLRRSQQQPRAAAAAQQQSALRLSLKPSGPTPRCGNRQPMCKKNEGEKTESLVDPGVCGRLSAMWGIPRTAVLEAVSNYKYE